MSATVNDAIIAGTSKLVAVGAVANAAAGFDTVATATAFTGGDDLPNVSSTDVANGLAALATEIINILVVGGIGSATIRAVVGAHVEQTENDGRERIAILGSSTSVATTVEGEVADIADKRIVLVAPGLVGDGRTDRQQP